MDCDCDGRLHDPKCPRVDQLALTKLLVEAREHEIMVCRECGRLWGLPHHCSRVDWNGIGDEPVPPFSKKALREEIARLAVKNIDAAPIPDSMADGSYWRGINDVLVELEATVAAWPELTTAEPVPYTEFLTRLLTEARVTNSRLNRRLQQMEADPDGAVRSHLVSARRSLALKDAALHEKNVALDALHYVWCSGSCEDGSEQWSDEKLTEEIVEAAERNTQRLRTRWNNLKGRREQEAQS